jgi:peptidoglycan/xylan/chitin deacetylase (PgdA/CDA1 family)
VRDWFAERPGITALAALLAPVLIGVVGLGLAGLLPDVAPVGVLSHFSLPIPFISAPEPTPTPEVREVVPAGRSPVHVPILEYHYIRINPDPRDRLGFNLSVTPSDFKAQMDWLQVNGYHAITLNDLRAYFQEQKPLPSRPIVLTFDDGYADFYTTAFPILQAHGFTAVSYVVPGFLDHPRYMTSAQVEEIDGDGIEIGAHTMTHADLTKAGPAQLVLEVQGSKNALERLLGHTVLDFCYPSGKFNDAVIASLRQFGLQSATTELPGTDHTWDERLTWKRVRANGGELLSEFTASLGTPEKTVKVAG